MRFYYFFFFGAFVFIRLNDMMYMLGCVGGFDFHRSTLHSDQRYVHQQPVCSKPNGLRWRRAIGLQWRLGVQGLGIHHEERDSDRRWLWFQRGIVNVLSSKSIYVYIYIINQNILQGCQPYQRRPCNHYGSNNIKNCSDFGPMQKTICKDKCINNNYKIDFNDDSHKSNYKLYIIGTTRTFILV